MKNEKDIAKNTCKNYLTATQLRKICEYRGWNFRGKSKDDLVEFVAPRLCGIDGVRTAMGTLEEPWKQVLHGIVFHKGKLDFLTIHDQYQHKHEKWGLTPTNFLRSLADNLLNRGVVLIQKERSYYSNGDNRFLEAYLVVPHEHIALLPPFSGETVVLGSNAQRKAPKDCIKQALVLFVNNYEKTRKKFPTGPVGELASQLSISGGCLTFSDTTTIKKIDDFIKLLNRTWIKNPKQEKQLATYILSHLPKGQGIGPLELARIVDSMGFELKLPDSYQICDRGYHSGQLIRGPSTSKGQFIYGASSDTSTPTQAIQGQLTCGSLMDEYIEIVVDKSDIELLFELIALSFIKVFDKKLWMCPSISAMGRKEKEVLETNETLTLVRASSPVYEKAFKKAVLLRDKTLLHTGLIVLHIDDLTLRTILLHRLGNHVKDFGGNYLAVPRGHLDDARKIIAKEGYTPRIISP